MEVKRAHWFVLVRTGLHFAGGGVKFWYSEQHVC